MRNNAMTNYYKMFPNESINYNVILIDGCQYLEMRTYMYSIVTHKGDCTNKIHCRQMEEILK